MARRVTLSGRFPLRLALGGITTARGKIGFPGGL
jgi:hypothetical protein